MKHEIRLDVNDCSEISEELYSLLCEAFAKKAEKLGISLDDCADQEWSIVCEGD